MRMPNPSGELHALRAQISPLPRIIMSGCSKCVLDGYKPTRRVCMALRAHAVHGSGRLRMQYATSSHSLTRAVAPNVWRLDCNRLCLSCRPEPRPVCMTQHTHSVEHRVVTFARLKICSMSAALHGSAGRGRMHSIVPVHMHNMHLPEGNAPLHQVRRMRID